MKNWQKSLIVTLITLAIGGIYLLVVFEHRRNPGVANQTSSEQKLTPDDVAEVRAMFPTSFDDVLKLQNTSVWMKNGYTMPYFPYEGGRIVFAKSLGVIPSAQRLDIKKVDQGRRARPGRRRHLARNAPGLRRLHDAGQSQASTPPPSASSTARRKSTSPTCSSFTTIPTPSTTTGPGMCGPPSTRTRLFAGMSELETRMAIGQKTQSDSSSEGNRTVTYDQAGKNGRSRSSTTTPQPSRVHSQGNRIWIIEMF